MILITGGTGFIGKNLVDLLSSKGYDLKLLVRDIEKARELLPKANLLKGDATKKETLKEICRDVEIVIHLVGVVDIKPEPMVYTTNVRTVKNVLEICKNVEKFIFSSSVDVFGPTNGIADESHPCNPIDPYGKSKLEAEKIIIESEIPYLILRLAIVYGKGATWFKKGLDLLSYGFVPKVKNFTHLVHVSDVAKAFELGIKRGKGIYIIADERPIKLFTLLRRLVILLGKRPIEIPLWLSRLLSTAIGMREIFEMVTMNRAFNITKAKKDLKYNPTANLDKELKNMVEWYKNLKWGRRGLNTSSNTGLN